MQCFLLQVRRVPDRRELVVWARRGLDGQPVLPADMPAGRVFCALNGQDALLFPLTLHRHLATPVFACFEVAHERRKGEMRRTVADVHGWHFSHQQSLMDTWTVLQQPCKTHGGRISFPTFT